MSRWARVWAPILPLLIYVTHVVLYIRHVNDDAFITFRYSRFLAMGRGPIFNLGEAVEGYSNFLLMLLLAPVYAIGGERAVPLAAAAIGIGSGGLILWLTYDLTGKVLGQGALAETSGGRAGAWNGHPVAAGVLAAGLVAVFPGFAVNCTSGLETALYGFLIMLAIYLGWDGDTRDRWRGSGLVWVAAAWTRPEGVAIFGVWWLARAVSRLAVPRSSGSPDGAEGDPSPDRAAWRRWIWDGIAFGGGMALQLGFRLLVYGQVLPNTYYAKMGGYRNSMPWEYVEAGALAPLLGVAGVGIGLVGWALSSRWRRTLPIAVVAVTGALLPFVTGTDWMPGWRFSVPYLAPLAIVVVAGWVRVLGLLGLRSSRAMVLVTGAVLAMAAVIHDGERRELVHRINLRAEGYAQGHRALAEWICSGGAAPGSVVALMDIGIVGYMCPDHRILDVSGLTDAHIARSPGPFLAKRYDMRYVLDQDPEIIVLTLTGPGDPMVPLPPDVRLRTWTETEHRLLTHPDFAPHYRDRRRVTDPTAGWLNRLAGRIGAERIFEHLHPDQYYLLAVFRRQP